MIRSRRRGARRSTCDDDQRDDDRLLADTPSDPEAFGFFFDRHYDGILRFFAVRVGSPDIADDLCAETMAAALEAVQSFDPARGKARQWLYGIARHKLSRYWRDLRVSREARERLGLMDPPAEDETMRSILSIETETDSHRILGALDSLPHDQADAIRLRILSELDYSDVAHILGCNEGAARVRVHRGLRRLGHVLGEP